MYNIGIGLSLLAIILAIPLLVVSIPVGLVLLAVGGVSMRLLKTRQTNKAKNYAIGEVIAGLFDHHDLAGLEFTSYEGYGVTEIRFLFHNRDESTRGDVPYLEYRHISSENSDLPDQLREWFGQWTLTDISVAAVFLAHELSLGFEIIKLTANGDNWCLRRRV